MLGTKENFNMKFFEIQKTRKGFSANYKIKKKQNMTSFPLKTFKQKQNRSFKKIMLRDWMRHIYVSTINLTLYIHRISLISANENDSPN